MSRGQEGNRRGNPPRKPKVYLPKGSPDTEALSPEDFCQGVLYLMQLGVERERLEQLGPEEPKTDRVYGPNDDEALQRVWKNKTLRPEEALRVVTARLLYERRRRGDFRAAARILLRFDELLEEGSKLQSRRDEHAEEAYRDFERRVEGVLESAGLPPSAELVAALAGPKSARKEKTRRLDALRVLETLIPTFPASTLDRSLTAIRQGSGPGAPIGKRYDAECVEADVDPPGEEVLKFAIGLLLGDSPKLRERVWSAVGAILREYTSEVFQPAMVDLPPQE